ncbi:MAG: c-type cytochrome [Myxococcota bacterium]
MSQFTDELLGHAEDNDGIEEYDNPLPTWWLGLFALTVVWGVAYAIHFHFVAEDSQTLRYEREMSAAAERWPQSNEAVPVVVDAASIAAGEVVFQQTCASCHKADGSGGIGPSLIDAEWRHGAEPEQVRTTITEGVVTKGMPAWGPVLGAQKIAHVAAFVVDLHAKSGAGVVNVAPEPTTEAEPAPVVSSDPLVAGEALYQQYCVACHGPTGEGTATAPSLVDAEWLHGGELDQIANTVAHGIEGKAMVAWGPVLGDDGVQQVASFVHHRANPNRE